VRWWWWLIVFVEGLERSWSALVSAVALDLSALWVLFRLCYALVIVLARVLMFLLGLLCFVAVGGSLVVMSVADMRARCRVLA
jgi:hypothetical protein